MELDNIKDLWNQEEVSETPDISTSQQKELHHPLGKIRKNMRMEFWTTLALLIPLVVILYFSIDNLRLKTYTVTLVTVMILIIIFYFRKFFLFYRELGNVMLNTKDSIKDLLHQFELNKQYYLSYYLAFGPAFVCEMILINEFQFRKTPVIKAAEQAQELALLMAFVMLTLLGLYAMYALGKWWFQYYYGKYVDDVIIIDTQINGGNEAKIKSIRKRRNSWFNRSERFFQSKVGNAGKTFNLIFWFVFYSLIAVLITTFGSMVITILLNYFER